MKALGTRTPEDINRLARWAVLALVAVVALASAAIAFTGSDPEPTAEPTVLEPLAGSEIASEEPAKLSTTTSTTRAAVDVLGVTVSDETVAELGEAAAPPTMSTTTLLPSTTVTASAITTTTSTTTIPPTATTTTIPPPTTTTTAPAATTTIPPTTTTILLTTTTTTAVEQPTIFVWDLTGYANCCDNEAWFAEVTVAVRSNLDAPAENVEVVGAWSGGGEGSLVVGGTDSNGEAKLESGPITAENITFTVLRLAHFDFAYDRSANRVSSITFGPE